MIGLSQLGLMALLFVGGGLGTILRFLISSGIQRLTNGSLLPVGTLFVNTSGCLIIGFLAGLAESRGAFSAEWRLFLFIGLLGGFTTFSTFGYETFQLLRDGQTLQALLNSLLQVVLGVIGVWLGFSLSRLI